MEGNQDQVNQINIQGNLGYQGDPRSDYVRGKQGNQGEKLLYTASKIIIVLIVLQMGWLGFRGFQYFSKQKEAKRLAQTKLQKQEKEAEVLLQEIPEPRISKGFLEYYATEGGTAR